MDVVDTVEDKNRNQVIEAEGNFVVTEDGVVIEDIGSVEKCDVIVEGADDEVMDVVDTVEDKNRNQVIEAEGNFVVAEDGVVIGDIGSVEKCDVTVEGKKSVVIDRYSYSRLTFVIYYII
uniref:Uncharacterized protein n=1 Tax=Schizaphis graminum TaxID=13262 RepID=A0A2S2NG51_SCHGA